MKHMVVPEILEATDGTRTRDLTLTKGGARRSLNKNRPMGDGRSQSVADTGGKARVQDQTPSKIADHGRPLDVDGRGSDCES